MTTNKTTGKIIIALLSLLTLIITSLAVLAAIDPSQPTSMTYRDVYGPGDLFTPTKQNDTRGYVYVVNIQESQPSYKWKGYVGNISGEYALLDNTSNALFDWDIVSTTGEVYATRMAGGASTTAVQWAQLACLSRGNISIEAFYINHSTARCADASDICIPGTNATTSLAEDTYERTWKTSTDSGAFNNSIFYSGNTQIATKTCFGAYLNQNNSDVLGTGTADWQEVLLTDNTFTDVIASGSAWNRYRYDVVYAGLIENNSFGFNNQTYDFQMIVPEYGLETTTPGTYQIAYYFYVELV